LRRGFFQTQAPALDVADPGGLEAAPANSAANERATSVSRGFLQKQITREEAAIRKQRAGEEDARKRSAEKDAAEASERKAAQWDSAERERQAAGLNVQEGACASFTAEALSRDYQKWDTYDDDDANDSLDDVSDDEAVGDGGDAGGIDLDAMTGPREEVARIQAHWKREARAKRREDKRAEARRREEHHQRVREAREQEQLSAPSGPLRHRPCEYRPPNHKDVAPSKALNEEYRSWKKFDANEAMLDLDNDGKTEEGRAMRCEARPGSAMISHVDAKKDREEFELDEDIEKHMGGLKKIVGQRLKDAAASKSEGNSLFRNGRASDACSAYLGGIEMMELCKQAQVIMSDSMSSKVTALTADLRRNLAAAQLQAADLKGCVETCDALLGETVEKDGGGKSQGETTCDEKALYRRAEALLRLGKTEKAQRDIEKLASVRGQSDAVVKRLRADVDRRLQASAGA
jgi:hypothetical protein